MAPNFCWKEICSPNKVTPINNPYNIDATFHMIFVMAIPSPNFNILYNIKGIIANAMVLIIIENKLSDMEYSLI